MIVKNAEVPSKALFAGASRKVLARGGGLMAVEVRFAKGSVTTSTPTRTSRSATSSPAAWS